MERERGARRTVRCGLHGRFYDAWAAGGCPDCSNGGPASRSRLGAGVSASLLLLAGGLALAWWQGGLPLANTTRVEPSRRQPARVQPAPEQPVPLERAAARPELAALERFAGTLASMLEEGRGEAPPLGWGLSVSDACANAPPAPAAADAHGAAAHQLLGEACEQLRAAPPLDPLVPAEAQRREALDQAAARLAAARAELERAARP
jgi:hypothetical protein